MKKLILTGRNEFQLLHGEDDAEHSVAGGLVHLKVLFCAVCRTDAKMWSQGHRDLVLPRVLGHEMVVLHEESGTQYTVWPGQHCGQCMYCLQGRENLCQQMK